MAPFLIKPENALRRAEELINVGQSQAALQNLHEMMTNRRYRQYTPAHEHLMLKLVELCVELRKGKVVKEALHAFKNMAQNVSVPALEAVVTKFLELAESRVESAQIKADLMTTVTDDLEEAELSPESMMLCTVTALDNKDRTDREVVTPWLKFLWETYRTVLDVLKNNAKLEPLYQQAAQQAFNFCLKYKRKTELRRLSELLRNHLLALPKYAHQSFSVNLNVPESMQAHLNTRFLQLNATTQLELWQEAFRSIEDIHGLVVMAKKAPKPIMMINFYEKLTKIFLVADNYLFHAAGWAKYYGTATQHMQMSDAESSRVASMVLLSALAAPITPTSSSSMGNFYDFDDGTAKTTRLTALLGMSQAPTRGQLISEALNRGLLKRAQPSVRLLYELLEQDFHPLSITRTIQPVMALLAEDAEMAKYVRPLYRVVLTRLLQQLSEVYSTIKLDSLLQLTAFPEPYRLAAHELEQLLVHSCRRGELAVRINHHTQTLTFDSKSFSAGLAATDSSKSLSSAPPTPADLMRTHLSHLANRLNTAAAMVDPTATAAAEKARRQRCLQQTLGRLEAEHKASAARRAIIERRKELQESAQLQKEKEEQRERALRLQREHEAEKTRLADEARRRELERIKRERAEIERQQTLKIAEELAKKNVKIDVEELSGGGELDKDKLMQLQVKHIEDEKRDAQTKLKTLARRIDHTERAYRLEEIPLIRQAYEAKFEADRQHAATTYQRLVDATKNQHDVVVKQKLNKIRTDVQQFKKMLDTRHADKLETLKASMRDQLEQAKKQRIAEVTAQREKERAEAERLAKEAADLAKAEAKAAAEAAAAEAKATKEKAELEAAKIERLRREKEQRMKDMEEAQETARKQRQREAEAEQRAKDREAERARERLGARAPVVANGSSSSVPTAAAKTSSTAPSPNVWRPSRVTGKPPATASVTPPASATTTPSSVSKSAEASSKPAAYVPPSRRARK